jgi:hypothetical protein
LDLDLADSSPKTIDKLIADPCALVDTLWVLCRKQALEKNVTDEQFGAALVGDTIDDATSALIEAIVDFTPGQRRLLLRKAVDKSTEVMRKAESLALAKIDDPDLMKQVEQAITQRMDEDIKTALTRLNSPMN